MTNWLVSWLLSALSLVIVANVIPGIQVTGFAAALIAALVFGFVNGTIGFLLKLLTFPLTILTLGIFWLVINALMLKLYGSACPRIPHPGIPPGVFRVDRA
jgi:putative membrane protein